MIPATHWADGEDGTAWVVMPPDPIMDGAPDVWCDRDRPCDTCDGDGWGEDSGGMGGREHCSDCDGTGRHTFDVEVGRQLNGLGRTYRTHRVSIVPGMVLPIHGEGDNHDGDLPHVCHADGYLFPMPNGDDTVSGFPMPAAAPGMWAIQLRKANR